MGPRPSIARVQIEAPSVQVQDLVWQGGLGALELAGQILLIVFLAYYLLGFRRSLQAQDRQERAVAIAQEGHRRDSQ